jgi:hypothetical protein
VSISKRFLYTFLKTHMKNKLEHLSHRYLRKSDCSSFVMCLLLALPLPKAFLWQPLTELTKQTRQAIHAFNQSIFLRFVPGKLMMFIAQFVKLQ